MLNEMQKASNLEIALKVFGKNTKFLVFRDILWGEIYVPKNWHSLIEHREFQKLKEESQLGFVCESLNILAATSTRYIHSFGVYNRAMYDLYVLMQQDQEFSTKETFIFLVSKLLHDVGHGPFSHAHEKITKISHEILTLKIVAKELRKTIDEIYGGEITDELICYMQDNTSFPKDSNLCMLGSLHDGILDDDKKDYVIRDLLTLRCEDYKRYSIVISNAMRIKHINGAKIIVYDINEAYTIASFLKLIRLLYRNNYYHINNMTAEDIYEKLIDSIKKNCGIPSIYVKDYEMKKVFRILQEGGNDTQKRYASTLLYGVKNVGGILNKVFFNDIDSMNTFIFHLRKITPIRNEYCSMLERNYNQDVSKIYFTKNDGTCVLYQEVYDLGENVNKHEIGGIYFDLQLFGNFLKEQGENERYITRKCEEVKECFLTK